MEERNARSSSKSGGVWLNRTVAGMGLTSLLSDFSHEMATAILPGFLAALGVSAAALGLVEGVADGLMSFTKLWAGWLSDRLQRRKPLVVGGYFLTGGATGLLALATGWPTVLLVRAVAWFGRGARSPARNSILASSIPSASLGKAFGFERAGDTIGAIAGPLVAVVLLAQLHPRTADTVWPFRIVFALTLIPGLAAGVSFAALVRETPRTPSSLHFRAAMGKLPAPFRRALWGVGIFGLGDFAHTLMILAAAHLLTASYGLVHAAQIAALLYVVHNIFYTGAAYPVGALSDRLGRRLLLTVGYLFGAAAAAGLAAAFIWKPFSIPMLLLVFALAGISAATSEAVEGALTADFVDTETRGIAYGTLGAVNGAGDLIASLLVGFLWTAVSPAAAFAYASLLMAAGAIVIASLRWEG
jgi:MFS family permease